MNSPAALIAHLATAETAADLHNPYGIDNGPAAESCRHNLHVYLTNMQQREPAWLLVGEAPGYRGCRLTGIPFTSEAVLWPSDEAGVVSWLGHGGEELHRLNGPNSARREATATIVWRTLRELALLPVLWNVLPFHPYAPERPDSNRTPTRREIDQGERYLRLMMDLFPAARPVAVGRKSELALSRWGIDAPQIRHPSHGGARQFRNELAALTGGSLVTAPAN